MNQLKAIAMYALSIIIMLIFCKYNSIQPNDFLIGSYSMLTYFISIAFFTDKENLKQ